jgi:hypothetical protein
MSGRLWGDCPICGRPFRVKKDGSLWSHTNGDSRTTHLPFSSHCSGSGRKPRRTFMWPPERNP